jgi:hypothetical protein
VKKGVDSHPSKWQTYLVLFVYKLFISNLIASFICSASGRVGGVANEGSSASGAANTSK